MRSRNVLKKPAALKRGRDEFKSDLSASVAHKSATKKGRKMSVTSKEKHSLPTYTCPVFADTAEGRRQAWDHLNTKGFVVIPVPELADAATRKRLFESFVRTIDSSPIRRQGEGITVLSRYSPGVMAGFGRYNDPVTYHSVSVRRVSALAYKAFRKLARTSDDADNLAVQMVERSPCVRLPEMSASTRAGGKALEKLGLKRLEMTGVATSRESYHRDTTLTDLSGDDAGKDVYGKIYGGWVAVQGDQSFIGALSDAPKGEIAVTSVKGKYGAGFSAYDKKRPADAAALAKFNAEEIRIIIPAGHMFVFRQEGPHRVAPNTVTDEDAHFRVFTGFRTVDRATPEGKTAVDMLPEMDKMMDDGGVPRIKSHQKPPSYPQSYVMNWGGKRAKLSVQGWNPKVLEPLDMKRSVHVYAIGTVDDDAASNLSLKSHGGSQVVVIFGRRLNPGYKISFAVWPEGCDDLDDVEKLSKSQVKALLNRGCINKGLFKHVQQPRGGGKKFVALVGKKNAKLMGEFTALFKRHVLPKHWPSLKELNKIDGLDVPMHKPYSDKERAMYHLNPVRRASRS